MSGHPIVAHDWAIVLVNNGVDMLHVFPACVLCSSTDKLNYLKDFELLFLVNVRRESGS